jgi:hypothetical protein
LERSWVESEVCAATGTRAYQPQQYAAVFGDPLSPGLARVIERRIEQVGRGRDPLDDLIEAAPERVLQWMRRKAALADGTGIGWPVCDPEDLSAGIAVERSARANWRLRISRSSSDAWQLVEIALLRELCGSSWPSIGARVGLSAEGAARCYRRHALALETDGEYAAGAARVAATAIERCYGTRPPNRRANCIA